MFERFTTDARQVVRLAQDEARQLRHPSVGTEHLVLALAANPGPGGQALQAHGLTTAALRSRLVILADDQLDPDALATLGIDLDQVKRATEANLGPGALDRAPRPPVRNGHLPFAKEAKKALELSLREALHLKSGEIGSGHLLLGILREGEGLGMRLLLETRVAPSVLRAEVISLMETRAA